MKSIDMLRDSLIGYQAVTGEDMGAFLLHADEIEAEIAEVREITRKKHQTERVYWHNELHKILDAINGRERYWGNCMDYPLPEATIPPSEVAKRMLSERYMLLPVDADGVPIHVGDMVDGWGTLDMLGCGKQPVHGMYCAATIAGGIGWRINNEYGFEVVPKHLRHVKPRPLEYVLRDCCDEYYKACKSEYTVNLADIHRKYADEIRELLGGDAS